MPDSVKSFLSTTGLLLALLTSLVVLANNAFVISQHQFFISSAYLFVAFAWGLRMGPTGLALFIFVLPLLPTLHFQIYSYLGLPLKAQHAPGFEVAAGYFLGTFSGYLIAKEKRLRDLAPPWQIGLVLCVVTISTGVAIARNLWQAASPFSTYGLFFNLVQFRINGFHDDYWPLTDWIAYGLAGAVICVLVPILKNAPDRDQRVFRPLMAGILVAALLGVVQARTGLGIPDIHKGFRRDALGVTAFGFQPDLHAYAGHMLLGAFGLWGYLLVSKSPPERRVVLLTVLMGWVGLIFSKSRGSLLLALFATAVGGMAMIWRHKRPWFSPMLAVTGLAFAVVLGVAFFYPTGSPSNYHWLTETLATFRALNVNDIDTVDTAFNGRPGLWLIALRMLSEFPIFGIGQGEFGKMGANLQFGGSAYWAERGGENAHNYFLQTLTETGLIGASAFALALLAPFALARNARSVLPAAVGLISIFLGNIVAHSLLVRENLMVAAVLLALAYSWVAAEAGTASKTASTTETSWLKRPLVAGTLLVVAVALAAVEVYRSFHRFPYKYGSFCHLARALTEDKWSAGIYEVPVPAGVHGIRLELNGTQPDVGRRALGAQIQVVHPQHGVLARSEISWSSVGPGSIELRLPGNKVLSDDRSKAVLTLSRCFTPRNLGINSDVRRLGVNIESIKFL